jgi:hypothetical protein
VYQNNEMAAILVYGTGISSFLFKYFVLFHHPTGATDHVSENDLLGGLPIAVVISGKMTSLFSESIIRVIKSSNALNISSIVLDGL